jgi:hypothetical protein
VACRRMPKSKDLCVNMRAPICEMLRVISAVYEVGLLAFNGPATVIMYVLIFGVLCCTEEDEEESEASARPRPRSRDASSRPGFGSNFAAVMQSSDEVTHVTRSSVMSARDHGSPQNLWGKPEGGEATMGWAERGAASDSWGLGGGLKAVIRYCRPPGERTLDVSRLANQQMKQNYPRFEAQGDSTQNPFLFWSHFCLGFLDAGGSALV